MTFRRVLPLTADTLRSDPSGNTCGLTENAGTGWQPAALDGPRSWEIGRRGAAAALAGTAGLLEVGAAGVMLDSEACAALQRVSGGTWAGCVSDANRIVAALEWGLASPGAGPDAPVAAEAPR